MTEDVKLEFYYLDEQWVKATEYEGIAYTKAICDKCQKKFVVKMKSYRNRNKEYDTFIDDEWGRPLREHISIYSLFPLGNYGQISCPFCGNTSYKWEIQLPLEKRNPPERIVKPNPFGENFPIR